MTEHKMGRRTLLGVAAALGAPLLGMSLVARAADFPVKPIRLIIGFGPGTGSDIQGRIFAEALGKEMKTPVIVENRPGVSGMLAAQYLAAAPADGYTLGFGTTASIVTLPLMNPNAHYDGVRDFAPLGGLAKAPFVVMTANRPDAPASLKELLERIARTSASYGSIGVGSFSQLGTLRLLQRTGLHAVHVPYKSSPQELQDVASGTLLFATDSSTAGLPLIRNGLLRALAVTAATRIPSLPDVPTMAEVIGSEFEHTVWTGILAPAATPPAIVQQLSDAVSAALATPAVQKRFGDLELQAFAVDGKGFGAYIRKEVPIWKKFIQEAGITFGE